VAAANGDANGLARALGLSVAGGGLVKYDGSHYDGIPQDRLPREIPTEAQCKAELASALIAERRQLGLSASQKSELADRANRNNQRISQLQSSLANQEENRRKLQGEIDDSLHDIGAQESRIEDLEGQIARGEGNSESRARAQSAVNRARDANERARSQIDHSREVMRQSSAVEATARENIGKLQQENRQILELLAGP
jgi:chromosome segregation ATPase